MYFVVFTTDKPGMQTVRMRTRPAHRAYLREHQHPVSVIIGGPTLSPKEQEMNGTLLIVEAESLEQVHTFLIDDPYLQADLFEDVVIRPWSWGIGAPAEV